MIQMRRHHPAPRATIPVSPEIYDHILGGICDSGYEKEDWEIAAEAIEEWARRHTPDAIAMTARGGYQWKSRFLPHGTLLRTVFGGKNYHCQVEGDRILYNGKAVSPSGFVNVVGGIRRNAWLCLWILFPDSKDWKLADTLRTRERPRRARKPARNIAQPSATQASAGCAPSTVPPVPAPPPAQVNAASAAESSDFQHAIHDQVPLNNPSDKENNLQRRSDIALPPPRFMCGTDRRIHPDDRMAALLRQELIPLLNRMCAYAGMPPAT